MPCFKVGSIVGLLAGAVFAATTATAGDPAPVKVVDRGRQPQAAVDPSGRVHVAYGVDNEIRYVSSDDGGKTFGNPVVVASLPKLALGMRRGPRIAASGKAIVIAAISQSGEIDKGKYKAYEVGTLTAWRSTDGGRSWEKPVEINTARGSALEGLHALTVGPDGTFFAAWNDNRTQAMEVYGARSTDGGKTWTDEVRVHRSPERAICPCCHPSAAFAPDGTLYVMWRDQIQGHRDLYLARSFDGGKTFGLAEKQGEGTWSFNACPMDGGGIVARGKDSVDTVWMREGRIFAAAAGKPERSLGRGVQAWGTSSSAGDFQVWLDKRPGKLMLLAPGSSKPSMLAELAGDPMVAAPVVGRGPVVAVWEAADPAASASGGHGHASSSGPIMLSILSPVR